ncbi:MAG: hypothetical protein KAQ89_00305 [Planctomycetes bacterium]|nr:hypothetical protein [Planctomycetota bacterium]
MREIKFRAWDKLNRVMCPSEDEFCISSTGKGAMMYDCIYGDHDYMEELELMQYTGRKDKNGVEIYEDDILHYEGHFYHIASNWRNRGKSIKTEVNGNFPVKYEDNTGFQMYNQGIGYYKIHSVDVEVIGNIHENPELLEPHT